MFRRIEETLQPDPSFPDDLQQLGFFINNLGQICMIDAPEKHYVFHATNNDRVNEVRREAMQMCQRSETEKRLAALGLNRIYLPSFSTTKPSGPHIPILAPSCEILRQRKRVIVFINSTLQDLGILAYRQLQRELGINGGSLVNFLKELIKRSNVNSTADQDEAMFKDGYRIQDDSTTPALVVLNTGQLLYSHKHNQAKTLRSWLAMPRKSITHDMVRIHEVENSVPGHRNAKQHVKSVLDEVIYNPERVAPDAEVYVIAIEDGTETILDLLAEDFDKYGSRITAMALVESIMDGAQIKDPKLEAFLHQRTRHWKYSDLTSDPLHCTRLPDGYKEIRPVEDNIMKSSNHICWHENVTATSGITKSLKNIKITMPPPTQQPSPPNTPDSCPDWSASQALCPTFAGGSIAVAECVFTAPPIQNAILSFFEEVAQDPSHYTNPAFTIQNSAPQPTAENPFTLSADANAESFFLPPKDQLTPEQATLADAHDTLTHLHSALAATQSDLPALQSGRHRLVGKIVAQERLVEQLESAARESVAAQGAVLRGQWKRKVEGPKVGFAGAMVDSELLRDAGLLDGEEVDEKENKEQVPEEDGMDGEHWEDEEKAFL